MLLQQHPICVFIGRGIVYVTYLGLFPSAGEIDSLPYACCTHNSLPGHTSSFTCVTAATAASETPPRSPAAQKPTVRSSSTVPNFQAASQLNPPLSAGLEETEAPGPRMALHAPLPLPNPPAPPFGSPAPLQSPLPSCPPPAHASSRI